MDPITIGTLLAGAKTGIDVIRSAADTVSAIRSAAKGPDGHKAVEVDTEALGKLADDLAIARVRALDILNLADQLQSENLELREAIRRKDQFSVRSARYRLSRYQDGAVAFEYVTQPDDPTPPHIACPGCYEDERITHLQPDEVGYGTTKMKCGRCGTIVLVANNHRYPASSVSADYNPYA